MKESSREEEEIGIRKCGRRGQVDIINKEVKGWTSSSKQQEAPPQISNTKEDIRLEQTKRKVERSSLEWDDFVLQAKLKSLIYSDCSLGVDSKKDRLIDELNFKKCMHLKRKTTSKLFVSIKKTFMIHPKYFDAKIYSHIHLFRISSINQTLFRTCQDK